LHTIRIIRFIVALAADCAASQIFHGALIPGSAHIGLTAVLESVATAIGAGMLVSGFVMSTVGFARGRTRREIEASALRDACAGGLGGILLLLVDIAVRFFA
jgi:hypothetical protein